MIVETSSNGYADASGVSPILVDFTITGASQRVGSHEGGTKMTISGTGFGDCSDVTFLVGTEHTCKVEEGTCTDTMATCVITKTATNRKIWNTGRHFRFGPGYLWEPQEITIRTGDEIQWQWNIPVEQEGTGISVHSVADGMSTQWDGKGFKSGSKSSKGYLKHVFRTEGTFYYNTEDVIEDEKSVEMISKEVFELQFKDNKVLATLNDGTRGLWKSAQVMYSYPLPHKVSI